MRDKDLINYYNDHLPPDLKRLHIGSWEDLKGLNQNDLEILFKFFSDLLTEIGLSADGEVNETGVLIDDICGKINGSIIKLKESMK